MKIFESKKNAFLKKLVGVVFIICFIVIRANRMNGVGSSVEGCIIMLSGFAVTMLLAITICVALFSEKIVFREAEVKKIKGFKSILIKYASIKGYYISDQNSIVIETGQGDVFLDISNYDQKKEIIEELNGRIQTKR